MCIRDRIKDRFDPGLEHAEASSPIERKLDSDLGPGQSQRIGLAFRVTRTGRLCHTVEVLAGGTLLASDQACVNGVQRPVQPEVRHQPQPEVQPQPQPEVRPQPQPEVRPQPQPEIRPQPQPEERPTPAPAALPEVSLKVAAPSARTMGETAALTIDVTNDSAQTLSNLRVMIELDPSMDPSMASEGYRFDELTDAMFWSVDRLNPGETVQFGLEARCLTPSPRARNRVKVVGPDGTLAEKEVGLEIRAAPALSPASLSMIVNEDYDPVTAGRELTYDIQVFNNGQQPDSQVTVVAEVPLEMTLVPEQTFGPEGFEVDGQTVRFKVVETIEPRGRLTYRLRVQAREPGEVRLRARLSSEGLRDPIPVEQKTTILPAQ